MLDQELDRFKTDINLAIYASSFGYGVEKKESSRNSLVLQSADDKLVVARRPNGHWVFFSLRNDGDNGTIIDFHQKRTGHSLGLTRKVLRKFSGSPPPPDKRQLTLLNLRPVEHDLEAMLREYGKMPVPEQHSYLEGRAIGKEIYNHPRFRGRIRIDGHGNAVFPHFDSEGNVIGFSTKNKGFTGFSAGGKKGVWVSHRKRSDSALFVTEATIDALSHFAMTGGDKLSYLSTDGAFGPEVEENILKLSDDAHRIVLGFDNDTDGKKYAARLNESLRAIGKEVDVVFPERPGDDWNDVLCADIGPPPSRPPHR